MPLANRTRAGRRDCGGGAPFCSALRAAQCEAEKGRASQKQRSDFLAAPVHMAPPGRQKSKREFCLFGGVLFVRRAAPYGGLAVLARLAAVMRAFAPGAPAFFLQALHTRGDSLAPSVLFACRAFVCAVPSCFGCLFHVGCTRGFLLSFAFSCLAVASQTSFHLSLRPRREFPCLFLSATLFPACGPLTSFCPTRAAGTCPPCALCAQFRLVLAVCLPVLRCLHAHFSLIFRLFLFGFCLSKFFSLVAQAATGLYFLPKRK